MKYIGYVISEAIEQWRICTASLLGIPVAGAVEVKKLGERLIAEAFASALLMGFLCPSCVFLLNTAQYCDFFPFNTHFFAEAEFLVIILHIQVNFVGVISYC